MKLDKFTLQYIETALWSSTDDKDEPLDSTYSIDDIAPETLEKMIKDCTEFQNKYIDDCGYDLGIMGHDFWLTRNRHGAGFWDGDYSKDLGERLTDAAHSFGECNLYVGDDGKIYS